MLYEKIQESMRKMGYTDYSNNFEIISEKAGIQVVRISIHNKTYIFKYFENITDAREIQNYQILKESGIPILKIYGSTEKAILIEDIKNSSDKRLGKETDLSDISVICSIARWYRWLHKGGKKYPGLAELYSEYDEFTPENILDIQYKSNTPDNPIWKLILSNINSIHILISNLESTLIYNDFYWTNMAVFNNRKTALMFDYNLLGRGYRYTDIRNVFSSLSPEASEVFLNEYGDYNQDEKIIDEAISDIYTLIAAYKKKTFPLWAEGSLNKLNKGILSQKLNVALGLYKGECLY